MLVRVDAEAVINSVIIVLLIGEAIKDIFSKRHLREGVIKVIYLPREAGQGLVEYALILVLVAIVVIVALALLGPAIGNIFSNIYSNI